MKLKFSRITHHASRITHRRSGSAVLVVLALIAIILIYLAGNLGTLNRLGRELKLLEQKQTRQLQLATGTTNALQSPPIPVATSRQE